MVFMIFESPYRPKKISEKQLKGINHAHRFFFETNTNFSIAIEWRSFRLWENQRHAAFGRVAATEDKQFKRVSPLCGQFAALHIHCKNTIRKRPNSWRKTLFIRAGGCFAIEYVVPSFRFVFFFSLSFHSPYKSNANFSSTWWAPYPAILGE